VTVAVVVLVKVTVKVSEIEVVLRFPYWSLA